MRKITIFILLSFVSLAGKAQTIYLDEPFSAGFPFPAASTTLSANNWTTVNGAIAASMNRTVISALTYPATGTKYALSGANSGLYNFYNGASGNSSVSYRTFSGAPISSGVVYLSFIYQCTAKGGSNSQVIHLSDSPTSGNGATVWCAGDATNVRLGVTRSSSTAADVQYYGTAGGSGSLVLNTIHFIVLKYDFTSNKAMLFIDPTIGGSDPGDAGANVYDDGNFGTKLAARPNFTYLKLYGNGANKGYFNISGVRVSDTWATAVAATLDAPTTNAATSITSTSFKANWAANSNASSYTLNVYQNDGTTLINSYTGISTNYYTVNSGLSLNTTYKYKVIAVGNASSFYTSAESTAQSVTTAAGTPPLDTPLPSSATSISTDRFIANWGSVASVVTYTLNVYQNDGTTLVGSPYTGLTGTSLLVTGLTKGTTYKYKILAVANGVDYLSSSESSAMSVTTTLPLLSAPTTSSATNVLAESFTANWTSNDANATGYTVKVYNSTPTLVKTVTVSGQSASSINITGLLVNNNYTYTVTAIADGINYANSTESNSTSFSTESTYPASINTNFSNGTWGTVYVSGSTPTLGGYPVYSINGWDLTHAYIQSGTYTGPRGEVHSHTLRLDKVINSGVLYLPTVASVSQIEIHSSASATRQFILEVSTNGGAYTTVGTYTNSDGLERIDIIPITATNAKFRITNPSSGAYTFYQIITRTTNPSLLSIVTNGVADAVTATSATLNWTPVVNASGGYKVYLYKSTILQIGYPVSVSGQGSTSVTINGITPNTEYNYKVQAIGNGDVDFSDSYLSTTSTFTTANTFNITGSTNASTLNLNASSNITVGPTGNLTINGNTSAASITINPNGRLTISPTFTLSSAINLQSDENGTATLVDETGTQELTGTVQQYLSTTRNWYISSPISNAVAPVGYTYYQRDEAGASWTSQPFVATNTFAVGRGYIALPGSTASVISFSTESGGKINTGDVSIGLTKGTNGFNLIGNPYPSHLTWTKAFVQSKSALIDPTIWYRTNSGASNTGGWSFITYNAVSEEGTPSTANGIIPPMQAFWVKAVAAGTLTLNSDLTRSHQASNPLKAPAIKNSNRQRLRLQIENGTTTDEALIYFDAAALDSYDRYDSPKFVETSANATQIYTSIGTEKLVINGMNSIKLETPIGLGFVPGSGTSFSIKANEISNLPSDVKVILKDNVSLVETDLTDGVSTYSFSPETISTDRFSIIFRTSGAVTGLMNNTDNSMLAYYNNNQGLIIKTNNDKFIGSTVSVYNALGQQLISTKLSGVTMNIDFPYAPNVYFVKVDNVLKKVTVK